MRTLFGLALAGGMIAASLSPASAQYYGNGNVPSGSYRNSCSNISMRGDTLRASCTADNGQSMRSSLDVRDCNGTDISNNNGQLTCANGYNNGQQYSHHNHRYNNNGNGYGYGSGYGNNNYGRYGSNSVPQGSYLQSCVNVRMNGSTLSASCTATNGQRQYSQLNVNRCNNSSDIRNQNGHLRCY